MSSSVKRMLLGGALAALAVLSACSVLPERTPAPHIYDFGPTPGTFDFSSAAFPSDLRLAAIQAVPWLRGTDIHYRFLFDQPHRIRAYTRNRWVAPPPTLLHERLRDAVALADNGPPFPGQGPVRLELRLERFEQVFDTLKSARAVLRVRATLVEPESGQVLASRVFETERMTPTADAPGAVQALSALSDGLIERLARWIEQVRSGAKPS